MSDSKQKAAKLAAELGLPEGSDWGDISKHQSAEAAKKKAAELGLPEGSDWGDISKHQSTLRGDRKNWTDSLGERSGHEKG